MQKVSRAYKSQIKKVPFRNRTFVDVILGVINKEAQNRIVFDTSIEYTDYSNLDTPFGKDKVINRYASYEDNYIIPDGNTFVFAEHEYTQNQGTIRSDADSSIILDMGDTYSLAGLTIDFGTKYPTQFELILDGETRMITNNKRLWIYTEPLETRYIEINPLEWINGGSARLKIESFKCGYYKEFDNTTITRLSVEETENPVCAELSQSDLSMEVENYGRKYDVEKEDDLSRFFIIGQDVNANFGYELNDGSVEYVDFGSLSLKEWSVDSKTLKINATNYINTLEDTCLIGEYSEDGKSLYDLAVEVFTDLGIDQRNYKIDTRLKEVITHNPLPQLPHSQLLQIIANAGQCTLLRDRYNMYKIIPTAFISTQDLIFTITDNGHTENSNPQRIIDLIDNRKTTYGADYSKDYARVDETMYFANAEDIGYISSAIADENGDFETNPLITITTNKPFQFLGWTFDFIGAIPQELIIRAYYNNAKVYENNFIPNETEFKADDDYGYCDKIEIEFIKGSPNARVHLSNITTPPIVFTFTTHRDVIGSTKATMKSNVKMVELETTQYIKDTELTDCFTSDIEIEDGIDYSNYEVIFSNCIVADKFYVNDIEITPISYSGQHCYIDLSSYEVGETIAFKVNGYNLTTKNKTYRKSINDKGTTETYQNPLVDNEVVARANLNWLGIYESYNKTYEIENRGYPELEVNDLVGLEIPQLNRIANLRVISQRIDFSGGALSGRTTGIREV